MKRNKPLAIGAIAFIILIVIMIGIKESAKTAKLINLPNSAGMSASKPLEYGIDGYNLKFAVPAATEVNVSSAQGEQLRFSAYLLNPEAEFRGYVQLWKVKDLGHFLTDAKSLSPLDYRAYQVSNFRSAKYQGYQIDWTTVSGEKPTSGKEYWLVFDNTDYVVRLSVITDTADVSKNSQDVLEQIFNSLQIDNLPERR